MQTLKFSELPLSEALQQTLAESEFISATPIQAQAIPHLLKGKDVIGLAQTGSGKTLAFGLPALQCIDLSIKKPQILIICPTRELAQQVNNVLKQFAKALGCIYTTTLVGGESMQYQIRDLNKGCHIIVGTAGRIIDHLERGTLEPDGIHYVVLDEADEMLNMGFQEDIEKILQHIPAERQTALFSATMPPTIRKLCNKYLTEPITIEIIKTAQTAPQIEQLYFYTKPELKTEAIVRLIEFHDIKKGMVFCNTKLMVDSLVEKLQTKGISAEGLHGDMAQWQRNSVMNRFRNGVLSILVATDVAARGIDVDDVEAVFNYDVPQDIDFYVHRIGRTARAGKKGKSFTLVYGREMRQLRDIEHITKDKINKAYIPLLTEIQEKRKSRLLNNVLSKAADHDGLVPYLKMAEQILESGWPHESLVAALLSMQIDAQKVEKDVFEEENQREKNFQNLEKALKKELIQKKYETHSISKRRIKSSNISDYRTSHATSYRKLQLNIGQNAKVQVRDIVGAFTGEANIRKSDIGKVDVFEKHSVVEVSEKHVEKVLKAMHNNTIKGKRVVLEIV